MKGVLIQYFHWYIENDGQFWNKFREQIPTLQQWGFSAAWLPPAYKGADGANAVGYDTYDLFDLGEFDQKGSVRTKYGTKDEYLAAVLEAEKKGLAIYPDIVINHKTGGDEKEKVHVQRYNAENRNEAIGEAEEKEVFTKFTFPGRAGKYSTFQWDFHCFNGVDHIEGEDNAQVVYKILNEYGDQWAEDVDREKGNFDFLLGADIEFRNPAVTGEIKYWLKWYWDLIHYRGLRLDAVKHIPAHAIIEMIDFLQSETGADLFFVGEYWSPDLTTLVNYIDTTAGRLSLFDVPLQEKFYEASTSGAAFDLTHIFDNTLVASHPQLAVTIVANHDTQPLQSLEKPIEPWFKPLAYTLILLREAGYPCVFYPDLYGAHYVDKGEDGGDYEIFMPSVECLPQLLELRNQFAFGEQVDYFDHPNCIAWTRAGDENHAGCVVILSNSDAGFKEITLGNDFANSVFYDYLGHHTDEIHLDPTGKGTFLVNGGSVSVWIRKN